MISSDCIARSAENSVVGAVAGLTLGALVEPMPAGQAGQETQLMSRF